MDTEPLCFQFFYHMYSSGTLNVNFLEKESKRLRTLWSTTGEFEGKWLIGEVDLDSVGSGWIILEGKGRGYDGHIAVDDVTLADCILTSTSQCDITLTIFSFLV